MTGINEKQFFYLMGFYGSLKEKFTIMQFVYICLSILCGAQKGREKKWKLKWYITFQLFSKNKKIII